MVKEIHYVTQFDNEGYLSECIYHDCVFTDKLKAEGVSDNLNSLKDGYYYEVYSAWVID